MAGSVSGLGSSSLFTWPTRSRFRNRMNPVPASSIRIVWSASFEARPSRTTVASGGVMPAGGPAMSTDSESRTSGSSPSRRQVMNAVPAVRTKARMPPGIPMTAFATRYALSVAVASGVTAASTSSMAARRPPVKSPSLEPRPDDVIDQCLLLVHAQVRHREAATAVRADDAVLQAGLEADQDHESVVEPAATHAPLVQQTLGQREVGVEGLGRAHLEVDRHLCAAA